MKRLRAKARRRMHLRRGDNSGIILIVVLWTLVILSMLSIGLGQRTRMELSLTQHSIGKLKSKYLAWSGLMYVMKQIEIDSKDEKSKQLDTIYLCGVNLKDKDPEEIFKHVPLGDGYFEIGYSSGDDKEYYGLADEERKININAVSIQNYSVLVNLLTLTGLGQESAESIAASIIDWKDADDTLSIPNTGAEDKYYADLEKPYHCKNRPFDSLEELLLVKDVTKEVYDQVKDHITIYPKEGNLLVNFDTAPKIVLQALGRSSAGADPGDIDSMVNKIITYRMGVDGVEYTEDDRQVDMNELGLNTAERAIFLNITPYRTKISNYFRAKIKGVYEASSVKSDIDTVISRN